LHLFSIFLCLETFGKDTTLLCIIQLQIFLFRPLVGWWVGKAEKWRSSFWGVGLAVRCERSEHGKSQLSIKYFCTIVIVCHSFFRVSP
jgi:hypothetical protein